MTQLQGYEPQQQPQLGKKAQPSHEKRHVSQSQLETQALCRLFRSTGGSTDESESSSWKKQTGWHALEQAAKQSAENLLARGTMETQFPLFGVTWERNHVVAIDLSGNGLCGKIPSDIAHLRFLKTLQLRNNPKLKARSPLECARCRICDTAISTARFHSSGAAATVCFLTTNPHGNLRWTSDITESEVFMMHSSLKNLHERPKIQETAIECNARNATGPERTAAAIELQRIYRARIERTKFRKYLKSLFQRSFDPNSGLEYFVDARTGKRLGRCRRSSHHLASSSSFQTATTRRATALRASQRRDSRTPTATETRQYYWNSITGESTWEPPVLLSRIYQELEARYGADKTDEERSELFFQDIDKDSTGEISKDEFALLCGELGMAMSNKQVDRVFSELDTSGDGELSRQEIIA